MNYYNEFDPKSAAWLRDLIGSRLIPNGIVDERSIAEVNPGDLRGYRQCHFFAGIGGWSLALQLAGWPADRPVWTGSCPCQPFSAAGKGLAQADKRHLWPVFFDLIRECRPEHVFGEQVASAVGHGWLDGISADLEEAGYACGAVVLGSHSVGAPHIRQRLYWVADAKHAERREVSVNREDGRDGQNGGREETHGEPGTCGQVCGMAVTEGEQHNGGRNERPRGRESSDGGGLVLADSDGCQPWSPASETPGYGDTAEPASFWSDSQPVHCRDGKIRRIPTEPAFFPLAHGVPARVVRLRGYGNAIVPQVASVFIQEFLRL